MDRQLGRTRLEAVQHVGMNLAQEFHFEPAQLAVGDDEKVPAAAGRIEEGEPGEPFVERLQLRPPPTVLPGLEAVELGAQVVEEQGLDDLHDVLFGLHASAAGTSTRSQNSLRY
jgi:hypothetical protein